MWQYTGFWIIGFIDNLVIVTTNYYNNLANFRTLQYTRADSLVYQSVTRRFLVTASTMVIPLPPAEVFSSQTPVHNWLSSKPRLAYNISKRTTSKTQLFDCCSPTIELLRICCQATGTTRTCAFKTPCKLNLKLGLSLELHECKFIRPMR
jgi:hypothetical protein